MKKHQKIFLCIAILIVILLTAASLTLLSTSQSVWDIAECIGRDDDFYIWISDEQHHTHYINSTEVQPSAKKVMENLKLSQKSIGNHTFHDCENMIVLETSDHRVQYFLFNKDFAVVWVADNRWIYEKALGSQNGDTYNAGMIFNASEQYDTWSNTECAAYRVKNPRAVRELFEDVCCLDDKYD